MTDYFYDNSATGTGSGDSPANAATAFEAMWSYITSVFVPGDRLWMRRSSVATFQATNVTTQYGTPNFNVTSSPYSWVIGWPRSGDPFFADRPGVARSAGWDTDVNTLYGNENLAVFHDLGSGTAGFHNGVGVANVHFVCVATPGNRTPPVRVTSSPYVPKWNVRFLNYAFNTQMRSVRDCTITTSIFSMGNNTVDWTIDRMTLTASCVIGEIFNNNFSASVKELVIETTSVQAWTSNLTNNTPIPSYSVTHYVDTVTGQKPFMDVGSHGTNVRPPCQIRFDNYYGEGPYQITARRMPRPQIARSGSALINGQQVFNMTQCSSSANNPFNPPPVSGMYSGGHARARHFITWTQSVMCRITWPFFQTGSGQLNSGSSGLIHHMQILGNRIVEAQVVAGSGWTWTGDSTGVGSAWAATGDWIPSQSGSGFIDLMLGMINQSNNELVFYAQPQVNSQ